MKRTLKTSQESFILNWMKHFLKARNYRATPMDLLIFGLALLGLCVSGRSSTQGFNIGSPKQLLEKLTLVLGEDAC